MKNMSYKTSLILFFVIMVAGLGSYFAVRNGFYPVAIVNFNLITTKSFRENSSTAYRYFQSALLSSGANPQQLDSSQSQNEIKRAVLDKLISDILIFNQLKSETNNEFLEIAERNLDKFLENNKNVERGAKLLYGLELIDFRSRILLPQAYQEILEGRLFLKNEKLDDWLTKERRNARVLILSPNLKWENGTVKLSN